MPVTGTDAAPRVGGNGPVLDYVVQMRQFDQSALLDRALKRHAVTAPLVASLARDVERFHANAIARKSPAQDTQRVLTAALENFDELQALLVDGETRAALDDLRRWTLDTFKARTAAFEARDVRGFIRECHGDLHLGNIVLWEGRAIAFDCIEFNAQLRWIDVIDEVAFAAMDFTAHGRDDLACVFLNAYLEASGDYAGARCLPFYLVYRAMVRAKVNAIRASQSAITAAERSRDLAACRRYIEVARMRSRKQSGALIITHGYAGSGKSTLARELVAELGAICIRSDVERKRLHGLDALAASASPAQGGIYAAAQTRKTYAVLLDSARHLVEAGFTAIVDATFLQAAQRAAFAALAVEAAVPFAIVDLDAPVDCLRARILHRAAARTDPSEANAVVLDAQLRHAQPLTKEELAVTVRVSSEQIDPTRASTQIKAILTGVP